MMARKSIIMRVTWMFVAVSIILLASFGAYNYFATKRIMERQLVGETQALSSRLRSELPLALWNFDTPQIASVLDAEMVSENVVAIVVHSGDKFVAGRIRDASGKFAASKADAKPTGEKTSLALQYKDGDETKPVGVVDFYMSHSAINAALQNTVWMILVQVVLQNVVLAALLIFTLNSMVIRRLKRVCLALEKIASGDADLTRRLEIVQNDEIGDVGHWFNVFVERLQNVVRQIIGSAKILAEASDAMSKGAKDVAQRATEQSDIMSSMAAAMEEMTVGISHVSEHSNDVRTVSVRSGELSQQSSVVVASLMTGMQRISESVNHSAETIEALGRESEKISAIVNVIKDIADQTNLLALNAAIEAARAGEQGRGFAVVADEVRKLAERTTKSTAEISVTISLVQEGIREAVERMHHGVERVDEGLGEAQHASKAIADVEDCATRLIDSVGDIVGSISEQSAASTDIARRVEEIARIVDESDHAIGGVAGAASEVNVHADKLLQVVGGFKV
jgi:methyl-accepting chemotaxis protein